MVWLIIRCLFCASGNVVPQISEHHPALHGLHSSRHSSLQNSPTDPFFLQNTPSSLVPRFLSSTKKIELKMSAFTYGLDDPKYLEKLKATDGTQSEGRTRPGKKPARADEELSAHELEIRNRRRERNKKGQQLRRKQFSETTEKLRKQVEELEIENANLELDIESLIKQRDQIVATFIRQSWAQEIINKTLKINNNPTPKVTKPTPMASVIQTSTITLVKFTEEQQAQLFKMQVANTVVEPEGIKKEKVDDDDDDKAIPDQEVPILPIKGEPEFIVKTEQEFFDN